MNKLVKLSDLFEPKYGVNLELINLDQCNSTEKKAMPFVSRTEKNNGVSAFVYEVPTIEPNPAHTLSVAVSGSVLSTFYQPKQYYSGRDLYVLIPKKDFSPIKMLFYAKYISSNKYRYNYGRQANKTLRNILLPETPPTKLINDLFSFKNELSEKLKQSSVLEKTFNLDTTNWQHFNLDKLFEIQLGKPIHSVEIEDYETKPTFEKAIPYVTRTKENNGTEFFTDKYSIDTEKINPENCITIGAEGFTAFFQSQSFINGNKINILRNKQMNKFSALFICSILNCEIEKKFNYGRGVVKERLKQLNIKLPVQNGQPDFEFMENYIKHLKYSRLL